MRFPLSISAASALLSIVPAVAKDRILITSQQGVLAAELVDNATANALVQRLPLTLSMRDHLRQEKTGVLPASLPDGARRRDFSVGTLGLWGSDDFVIYYRSGQVPEPGIVVLGRVTGDVSILDRDGPVTIRIERSQ